VDEVPSPLGKRLVVKTMVGGIPTFRQICWFEKFILFWFEPLICICMRDKIIQLRDEGKSYRAIQAELKCSRGTISYHCGEGQKEKTLCRNRSNRSTLLGILKRKKDNFCSIGKKKCKGNYGRKRAESLFSSKDFLQKLTDNPICYLTGRKIDLTLPKTYQCDHIIPSSKGGTNSMDNMGLACKQANVAKNDMSVEEFVQLCKEVLEFRGYKITKTEG